MKFVIICLLVIVVLVSGLMWLQKEQDSHPCEWYVERNFKAKDVPFRCF